MKTVKKLNPDALIPNVYYFGMISNGFVLIMDLMGPSLEDLFNLMDKKFSKKTIILLALRIIRAIESFHSADFVHRDVKADNFTMGGTPSTSKKVFLLDFGLSKRCIKKDTYHPMYERVPRKPRRGSITGTVR